MTVRMKYICGYTDNFFELLIYFMNKLYFPFIIIFWLFNFDATSAATYKETITVAKEGAADFRNIQAAIDSAKSFPDKPITIYVKAGIYKEKVTVHEWNTNLSIIGDKQGNTIIDYDDYFDKIDRGRNSTFFTATMQVNADDFHADYLTVRNSAGPVGQAIALALNANRVSFYNSRFIGNQDTLYLTGEGNLQYFKNCYVEGTTDFIFGGATAVLDNCQIHAKSNSYITAASTPKGVEYGLVFVNCKLTAAAGVDQVYLGRPWRSYAKTAFINSELGNHITAQGWHNWSNPAAEKTTKYVEYRNSGPGASHSDRVPWSSQLTKQEAKKFTPEHILSRKKNQNWFDRLN